MKHANGQGQNLAQKKKESKTPICRGMIEARVDYACQYGLSESVFIYKLYQYFYFKNINSIENCLEQWKKWFPFWNKKQIEKIINNLLQQNIIDIQTISNGKTLYSFTKEFIAQWEI